MSRIRRKKLHEAEKIPNPAGESLQIQIRLKISESENQQSACMKDSFTKNLIDQIQKNLLKLNFQVIFYLQFSFSQIIKLKIK